MIVPRRELRGEQSQFGLPIMIVICDTGTRCDPAPGDNGSPAAARPALASTNL